MKSNFDIAARASIYVKSGPGARSACASSYKFRSNRRYTRDPLGRILQKVQTVKDNPSTPAVTTTSYTYHPGGQVASIRYPSGLTVNYRLGTGAQVGQITQVDVQEPGANQRVLSFVTNLTYTALGQPKSWNWNCLTGSGTAAASTANCDSASRSFDSSGRMTGNEFASYQYDAAGRITNITQNLWALQAAVPEVPATPTTPAVPAIPASYYPVPLSWTAGYDNRDRLTSFTRPGSAVSYTYDKNSNRLSSTDTTTSDTDLDGDFDAADLQRASAQTLTIANDSNRLLGWSQINTTKRLNTRGQAITSSTSTQVNYGLDAAGNLTSDGLRTFSYDASNRLTQVQVGDADEASKVTYLHNAAGQRVFKSEPQVAQTAPSEAELGADFITWLKKNFGWLFAQAQQNATLGQSFVYGDDQIGSYNLLGEYGNGGSKSAGRMEYIYLPTEEGPAQLIGVYRTNRFYAVHTDHLGTPRQIKDDTNKVMWQLAYSAFGDNKPTGVLTATTNPKAAITNTPKLLQATSPSFAVNLRFPGQYWDDEAKLSYNTFRNYQPNQGRYTQADPIGLEGGWSRFGYVGGNPLSFTDPTGEIAFLAPFIPWIAGGGSAAGWGWGSAAVGAAVVAAVVSIPGDTAPDQSRTVPYPDRKRGKYTCICRADKNGRSADNCSIDDKDFAMGYGEGSSPTEAKRAAEKDAKDKLGAKSVHHVQCRCRAPNGDTFIPTR